jgi:hypothetical protein
VELEHLESLWQESRERAATEGMAEGLAPLEHSHWDRRNKIDSVEAGFEFVGHQATAWLASIEELP